MYNCEHCKKLLEHLEEILQGRSSWELKQTDSPTEQSRIWMKHSVKNA